MTVYIKPSKARGKISAPPSKSMAHRALICAALSNGSEVSNIALSDDITATVNALKVLGASVSLNGDKVTLGGISPQSIKKASINAGESGSTLRFLIPLCMLSGADITFIGASRLFRRDLSVYEKIAKEQGIVFNLSDSSLHIKGVLRAGEYSVRGDISSQFVSGLMFALPLLEGDSFIKFDTPVESKPYIEMTVDMLKHFGIHIECKNDGYYIEGGQRYKNFDYTVEGDYSNAAFLDAFNLLDGSVEVGGLNPDSTQGDRIYKEYFKTLTSGGSYDLSDCPDLAPLLFALSAELVGAKFTGTARLKIKESDRAASMSEELSKFGATILVSENEVEIKKTKLHSPSIPLSSHNDHRVVMALSLLLSVYGGEIEGAEAVNKSYPGFFKDIKSLGIEVQIK